jgi:2-succinyl-6-hydroxy-2,4-cyclohexadiene-1-carboxylate synthase
MADAAFDPHRHPSRLAVEVQGAGPRLVLIHGFTQTGRSWASIAGDLSHDHEVALVDAPGHGGSSEVRADLVDGATLLADAAGGGVYAGYSMGARFALHVALARPDVVEGLVLLGATPGIEDAGEREQRRAQDEARAVALERDGVDAFLSGWLAQPLFAGLPPDAAGIEDRRRNTVAGLASSLRLAGTGAQVPRWNELARLQMPVLVLAGSEDHKFAAIGERMAERIGANATFAEVPGAGHAAHLERPEAFLRLLRAWLVSAR